MNRVIDIDVEWTFPDGEIQLYKGGSITLTDESIDVSFPVSSSERSKITKCLPAYIDLVEYIQENVKYRHAKVEGADIELYIADSKVIAFGSGINNIHWKLDFIKYRFREIEASNRCNTIVNAPFIYLSGILRRIDKFPKPIVLKTCKGFFTFSQSDSSGTSVIDTLCSYDDTKWLLIHLALYTNTFIERLIESKVEGKKSRLWLHHKVPIFKSENMTLINNELVYLNIGKKNDFVSFLRRSKWDTFDKEKKNALEYAVYTYARSRQCDTTNEFLLLFSIIDRFAGNTHGSNHYLKMKEGLNKYGIQIEKISLKTEVDIQKLKLKLIHDDGSKPDVVNFCDLRNYIMHFMTNNAIDEYLAKHETISNMRFVVCIILLKEFGFRRVNFKDDWKHLSVLREKIKHNSKK